MEKPVYYSKKYTQQMAAIKLEEIEAQAAPPPAPAAVKAAPRRTRVAPVLLILCLAMAILSVLLVPLLLGGAAPVNAAPAKEAAPSESVAYASVEAAIAAAGLDGATLPTLPEGLVMGQSRVVDGNCLEVDIAGAKNDIIFRAALGNYDLTLDMPEDYTFSTTEEVGGVTRGYAGVSDKKLNTAVWVQEDYCYALVCADGVDADIMRQLAESV